MTHDDQNYGRRCVCGLSSNLPICDGSHKTAPWSCQAPKSSSDLIIAASPSLANFAERLASVMSGQLSHETAQLNTQRLIRLIDATVPRPAPHIQASQALNIVIDVPHEVIDALIPPTETRVYLEEDDPQQLWRSIRSASADPENWVTQLSVKPAKPLPRVFLSHAVADEPLLFEPVHRLRAAYGLEIFVCVDSLKAGGPWREEIETALLRADLLIIAVSESMSRSTYCAYEVGFAHAMRIKTLSLSLDGSPPPLYLSHLHCLDLSRRRAQTPWLGSPEILMRSLIELIHDAIAERD